MRNRLIERIASWLDTDGAEWFLVFYPFLLVFGLGVLQMFGVVK